MRKETAVHILRTDFIKRPNFIVNGCVDGCLDCPIDYLHRNRTEFFDDFAPNKIKTAADSLKYLG